ncbi:MAG: hypothetical protein HZC41_09200 [Chloroflexi bacterium]|nr:hypothetical protein [Chloroflexota bacterium]
MFATEPHFLQVRGQCTPPRTVDRRAAASTPQPPAAPPSQPTESSRPPRPMLGLKRHESARASE